MRTIRRLLAAAAFAGALLAIAPPASAQVNPVDTLLCLTGSLGDIGSLLDPASITVPPEIAPQSCLAP